MGANDHPCGTCQFSDKSVWSPVAGNAVTTLARSFSRRDLETGNVVYHQGTPGEGVYCISRGLVAIRSFAPDGASMLLRLAYPGDLIGYRAFITGREHRTEAQAVLPSRVCVVAQYDAKQVIQACPSVLARIAERCADELDRCHEDIQEVRGMPTIDRLARLLAKLMAAHGDQTDKIRHMRLPISRQDIADILGIRPETLSRLMTRLQDEGKLEASGRTIRMGQVALV